MYHNPVMLKESVEVLVENEDGVYVDLTFGGGGHSTEILKKLSDKGKLIAFDIDSDSLKNKIDDSRFTLINQNFRYMWNYLKFFDVLPVDGVIADLGISSYQIDAPERGFSIRYDADLNMRMGGEAGINAGFVLNNYSEDELIRVFWQYGEIKNARSLANKIIKFRESQPFKTTEQLKEVANLCAPRGREYKYLAQVFQAIRIEVNDEINALSDMLSFLEHVLKDDGLAVIISYHSLEDRLVKNLFRSGNIEGKVNKDFYGNNLSSFVPVTRKPLIPSESEIEENPRARSAKLRVGRKVNINSIQ
ncbi:MAG: 16S rRNA (cytosine(1402)-N(4))-methyltransferase RsmH [Bacteroidales bacterium]|jgi:16S rRNA (cytosine1402-N4)-methyltransferase